MIKDVNIEFQPPDFSNTSIFDSFPMLIPKIVLPKITKFSHGKVIFLRIKNIQENNNNESCKVFFDASKF
jgi:hypothetical protein